MISKCHTKEIEQHIANYLFAAQTELHGNHDVAGQYYMGRLVEMYNMVWSLFRIDAISRKTFDALTDPIYDFEVKHGFKLICRFNMPTTI